MTLGARLTAKDSYTNEFTFGIDDFAQLFEQQSEPVGPNVSEGRRVAPRIAKGATSTVIEILVVDEDRDSCQDSPSQDKAPPFPTEAGKAGKNAQNIPDDTAPRNSVAVSMSGNATEAEPTAPGTLDELPRPLIQVEAAELHTIEQAPTAGA